MGRDADRYGRQGVPLGVLGLYADARERSGERLCGKLSVRLRLDDHRRRHDDQRIFKVERLKDNEASDGGPGRRARGGTECSAEASKATAAMQAMTADGVRLPAFPRRLTINNV